jgi:hypothetical protein
MYGTKGGNAEGRCYPTVSNVKEEFYKTHEPCDDPGAGHVQFVSDTHFRFDPRPSSLVNVPSSVLAIPSFAPLPSPLISPFCCVQHEIRFGSKLQFRAQIDFMQ